MSTDIVDILSSSDDEKDIAEICNIEQSSNSQLANKNNEKGTNLTKTVEDRNNNYNSTKPVIEIDVEEEQSQISKSNKKSSILQIECDNFTAEFNKFLDLCLEYEFCDGMIPILKKKLIPHYNAADKQYIQSKNFRSFMQDKLIKFEKCPQFKFSHIKIVCDHLISHCTKKRVDLITLSNKVSDHRKRHFDGGEAYVRLKAKKITEIIDLDKEIPIIDLELQEEQDDVILMEDECDEKENSPSDINTSGHQSKNDSLLKEDVKVSSIQFLEIPIECIHKKMNEKENSSSDINTAGHQSKNDSLLKEDVKVSRLQFLEKQIECIHKKIKLFEVAEVNGDDKFSPYIYCDSLKEQIVKHYQEYCSLIGEPDFQSRPGEITVSVTEGHPTGPARKLNEWLKENLNKCRNAFPDIVDVVKCVRKACDEDNLSWTTNQILNEARILFIACGKAMQRRRKKREWRDLKYKIKEFGQSTDRDPAEDDPELSARLEVNRCIAISKENDILDYYAKLPYYKQPRTNNKITILQAAPSNISVPADNPISNTTTATSDFSYEVPIIYDENMAISCQNVDIPIKTETYQVPRPIDPNIEIVCSDSEDYSTSENEDSDFELDDLLPAKNINANDNNKEDLNINNNENIEIKREIKTEIKSEMYNQSKEMTAVETLKMLMEFDNNGTSLNVTTILDTEKMVTIEIYSSDSESDSDCEVLTDNDNERSLIEPQNRPIGAVVVKSSQLTLS